MTSVTITKSFSDWQVMIGGQWYSWKGTAFKWNYWKYYRDNSQVTPDVMSRCPCENTWSVGGGNGEKKTLTLQLFSQWMFCHVPNVRWSTWVCNEQCVYVYFSLI